MPMCPRPRTRAIASLRCGLRSWPAAPRILPSARHATLLPQEAFMPPSKLAHIVFQTNRIEELRDWYCAVLGGQVIYENPNLSFVTYDDEHHRVAFVNFGPLAPRDTHTELMIKRTEQPGLHHVAFTFGSMGELL